MKQNGQLYKSLFEHMIEGFVFCRVTYDSSGEMIDHVYELVNPALERITGLKDIVGKSVHEVLPTLRSENPVLWHIYQEISKGGEATVVERYIHPLKMWLKLSIYSVEEGTFTVVFEDITDHRNMLETCQAAQKAIEKAYQEAMFGFLRALQFRDPETEQHSQRVVRLTLALARRLGVPEDEILAYEHGALLHDIGKLFVSDTVLRKPSKLDAEEIELMNQHALLGYEFLKPIAFMGGAALDIPRYHHERWDGSGYPEGLSGEEIPLAARIFAIADVWDAMTTARPYRKPFSKEFTLKYMIAQSGILFDPGIVDEFVKLIDEEKE